MKKTLMELTTEEFVRLLCDVPKTYELELKFWDSEGMLHYGNRPVGKYEELHDFLKALRIKHGDRINKDNFMTYLKDELFDYDMELSVLDTYDYLEEKTKGFDETRVRFLLKQIEDIHLHIIQKERMETINLKIDKGWKGYSIKWEFFINSERHIIIDYDDAFKKVFGEAYDDNYNQAITILKEKEKEKVKQTRIIPPELKTERAIKYFAKAVKIGYIQQTDTGYKKFITKALLAYFLELVFCRDDEGKENGKDFPEVALNKLFKEERLGQARYQIINNHNGNGKPKGYEKIDELFNE